MCSVVEVIGPVLLVLVSFGLGFWSDRAFAPVYIQLLDNGQPWKSTKRTENERRVTIKLLNPYDHKFTRVRLRPSSGIKIRFDSGDLKQSYVFEHKSYLASLTFVSEAGFSANQLANDLEVEISFDRVWCWRRWKKALAYVGD